MGIENLGLNGLRKKLLPVVYVNNDTNAAVSGIKFKKMHCVHK